MKQLILIILALLVFSCGDKPTTPTIDPSSSSVEPSSSSIEPSSSSVVSVGKLGISGFNEVIPVYVQPRVLARKVTEKPIDLNGGTVKYSKEVKFLVKNIGTAPIESLVVTTSNPNLVMSSDTMFIIPVNNQPIIDTLIDNDGNIISIDTTMPPEIVYSVILNHGADYYSNNYVWPLLKYGNNVDTLYFSGVSNGIKINQQFTIGYNAIYVNLITIPPDSIIPHNFAVIGTEASYNGISCKIIDAENIINRKVNPSVGDSIYRGDIVSGQININTDCTIKQKLPTSLQ